MKRYKRKKSTTEYKFIIAAILGTLAYSNFRTNENIYLFVFFLALFSVAIFFGPSYISKQIRRKKYLNSPLSAVDQMSGEEFENYLQAHFSRLGYKASLTPASNDYGADLILHKNGFITVVQAKRYRNKVSNKAIQEVVAAKGYYHAEHGIVITNSYFTKNAYTLAERNHIELWNREDLKKRFHNNPQIDRGE